MSRRPFLVVISGLPAAGKSTLARRLATDLSVPLVCRDALRDAAVDGLEHHARSLASIATATTRLVNEVLTGALASTEGAVLDGNFNRPDHADGLAEVIATHRAQAVEVCLWADSDVLRARFQARADPPLTADLRPYFESVLSRPRVPVLPDARVIEFDTTDFEGLDAAYEDLLASIHAQVTADG